MYINFAPVRLRQKRVHVFGAESKEPFDVFQCKIAQRSIVEMIYILNNY